LKRGLEKDEENQLEQIERDFNTMTARDVYSHPSYSMLRVLRRPGYDAVGRQTSVLQQLHSNCIQRSAAGHLRRPVELPGRTGADKVLT